ncbi:response regulator [Pseudacidovorax sp. RU35E]|jgi:CheY-like chemotaxis protein|uniref:response regulator n=1 Tax=Pseudacidovorax sp. RU35E TaxID=1907403 RepID=UPI0013562F48|nr:response regulator [Pseudacidovorax sp. RU35E]
MNDFHILVVDDDEDTAQLLKLILQDTIEHCTVGVAYDGVEAIESVRRTLPTFVVFDLEMPRMDGEVAANHLLKELGAKAPMLLAVSGNALRVDGLRLSGPFTHCFTKPLDLEKLIGVLSAPRC